MDLLWVFVSRPNPRFGLRVCFRIKRKDDDLFLREYVYVDIDRVRGLAGQLYDGIPERATNISARQRSFEVDAKIVRAGRAAGQEDSTERSLGDSLFKDLEADLEALGLLADISETLSNSTDWNDDSVAPGQMVRITAPGSLFHPAQLSEALVGLATAAHGLGELGVSNEGSAALPPKAKTDAQRKAVRAVRQQQGQEPRFPEDYLPHGEVPVMGVDRSQLSGMIKVVRGIFGEGVHLHLMPAGPDGPTISTRLEAGRRFLDSSPEVLFSRYGLGRQEWTVVGIVGQLGRDATPEAVADLMNEDGTVGRAKFVDLVGNFLGSTSGLVDLPQAPGFSLVPLAVYRTIGHSVVPD